MILGLTAENCFRLQEGKPIMFDLADLGMPPTTVIIVGGADHDDITQRLRAAGWLPPETQT